jgi:hypothetical protein
MEQSFILKYYGGYTIFEQINMPAEERKWNIERLIKEIKKQNEATSKSGGGGGYGGRQFT